MTSPGSGSDPGLAAQRRALRRRLAEVANAIACTEDNVADTFERLAVTLPKHAARLRLLAAQARANAAKEREEAGRLGQTGVTENEPQ
jgi:phage terminase Nu1 subunit (DNA packaging protein)